MALLKAETELSSDV